VCVADEVNNKLKGFNLGCPAYLGASQGRENGLPITQSPLGHSRAMSILESVSGMLM